MKEGAVTAAKANTPATGLPTITGTPQAGQTLTADTSGIADENGTDAAVFTYQWLAGGSDISGATASTYELSDDDVGQAVKVRVTFTDDAGHQETLTSAPTAAVEPAPNSPATGAPVISGVAQVGETLTADVSGIADDDGLTNGSYSYQWLGNDGTGDADIPGATASTYTLMDADVGKTIRVRVSFIDDAGNQETQTSAAAAGVEQGTAIWSADLTVGVKYEGTGYSDFTGLGSLSRADFSMGDTNYTVRLIVYIGDKLYLGLNKEMTAGFVFRVGASEFASGDASRVKSASAYLFEWDQPGLSWSEGDEVGVGLTLVEDSHQTGPDENSPATGLPAISGTARVGETLTADTSGIADPDGLVDASFSYQ